MKNLLDYIKIYEGLIESSTCDFIVDTCLQENLDNAHIGSGYNNDIRNCKIFEISENRNLNSFLSDIDELIFKKIFHILSDYSTYFPINSSSDTGYSFLMYNVGNFYKEHVDSATEVPRELTVIINLNDDYEGGEIKFFDEKIYNINKGASIVFPSNFMFPHEIVPVTRGVRYSIVTWTI